MSKQSYIKPNKLKVFRDLLVRGRYEEILSKSITNLIATMCIKKVLKYQISDQVSSQQFYKWLEKVVRKSIKSISHGYDLYDENELKKLNNLNNQILF